MLNELSINRYTVGICAPVAISHEDWRPYRTGSEAIQCRHGQILWCSGPSSVGASCSVTQTAGLCDERMSSCLPHKIDDLPNICGTNVVGVSPVAEVRLHLYTVSFLDCLLKTNLLEEMFNLVEHVVVGIRVSISEVDIWLCHGDTSRVS